MLFFINTYFFYKIFKFITILHVNHNFELKFRFELLHTLINWIFGNYTSNKIFLFVADNVSA